MEAFIDVTLPIFGIIFAGWLAGRSGLLGQDSTAALNGFVFYVSLPALFLASTSRAPVEAVLDVDLLLVIAAGYAATGLIAAIVCWLFFSKRTGEIALNTGCSVFANTGYMGIPLMLTAFGPVATNATIGAVLANLFIVLGLATAFLEIDKTGARGLSVLKQAATGLIKSPLLLACAAGLLISAAGLALPSTALRFLDLLGAAAGPCALFAMWLFLVGQSVRRGAGEVGWLTVLKLVVHPLATWLFAVYVIPLDPLEEAIAVLMATLPTGGLMFVLAQKYGVYIQRSTATILVSTIISVIPVSLALQYYVGLVNG